MNAMKDALEKALHERKLGGGLTLKISVEPDGDEAAPSMEDTGETPPDQEQVGGDGMPPQAPQQDDEERSVLKSMMGYGMDEDKALEDAEGRAPKSLGERAKLAAAKKLKSMK